MPATQRGQAYKIGPNRWGLRYYDIDGIRRRKSPFSTKSAALRFYRDVIEPQLLGERPAVEYTLREFVPVFLDRHAVGVRSRTVKTLRDRLGYPVEREGEPPENRTARERHAVKAFGDVALADLARMADEIAAWQVHLPARARHGIVQALRQCLDAAVRWGHMSANPAELAGKNPKTPPRPVRAFTRSEIDAISAKLVPAYAPLPVFASASGLRPEEWMVLERQDIDRRNGVLNVRRTLSDGEVVELAKTSKSRRQVPLSPRAIAALEALVPRLDTPLLFPAPAGGLINIDNFRRREWAVAIEAGGVPRPARIYDLRSTFASNATAAGIDVFELARVMGTSIEMIERHYGTLLSGAAAGIASRLAAFEADQEQADDRKVIE